MPILMRDKNEAFGLLAELKKRGGEDFSVCDVSPNLSQTVYEIRQQGQPIDRLQFNLKHIHKGDTYTTLHGRKYRYLGNGRAVDSRGNVSQVHIPAQSEPPQLVYLEYKPQSEFVPPPPKPHMVRVNEVKRTVLFGSLATGDKFTRDGKVWEKVGDILAMCGHEKAVLMANDSVGVG